MMAVVCNPVIQGRDCNFSCDCSIVDFTINVNNVCNGSTIAILAKVKDYAGNIHAVLCRTFYVWVDGYQSCDCVNNYPAFFDNVLVDIPSCTDTSGLYAECACCNYITNPCCC